MIDAHLGIITCDKCGKPMRKGEQALIISEGSIPRVKNDGLDFWGTCVRYACHLKCWDGVEEGTVSKSILPR